MTTANLNPLPSLVDAARLEELADAGPAILDLAWTSQDPCVRRHLDAVALADELLFAHEARLETAETFDTGEAATTAEGRMVHAARQLKAYHIDSIDRALDRELHASETEEN